MIVAVLALLFFALLGLLFFAGTGGSKEPAKKSETLYVIAAALKLRTQPDPKAPVVTTVVRGEKVQSSDERDSWLQVKGTDGITGWAERGALEGEAEHDRHAARVASIRKLPPLDGRVVKRTALYSGPGVFYPIVGELAGGERVKIFTRDHDFFAVADSNDVAYADVDSVDLLPATASAQIDVPGAATGSQSETPPPAAPEEVPQIGEVPQSETPPASEGQVYPAVPPDGTQPVVIEHVRPRYPVLARRLGTEGIVILRGIIRTDGSVTDVEVLRDLPNGLGDAAREAVERWRFRPATLHGRAIDVYYTVTVNFRLTG